MPTQDERDKVMVELDELSNRMAEVILAIEGRRIVTRRRDSGLFPALTPFLCEDARLPRQCPNPAVLVARVCPGRLYGFCAECWVISKSRAVVFCPTHSQLESHERHFQVVGLL